MTSRELGTSPTKFARIIGALYLVLVFVGPVAFFMGRTSVVVPDDANATMANLMASGSMFRLGMVAETIIVLVEIVISAMLYVLFLPVNRALSLASSFARFAQAILQAVNLMTAVPALVVLGGVGYLSAFSSEQMNALVQLFLDTNAFVIMIWGLVFGFHLVLLGYLVYTSRFLPKLLGVLLFIAAAGYLLQSYGHLLVPQYDSVLATVVIILSIPGELAFTFWLLIKGVDDVAWEERALHSAETSSTVAA